MKVGIIGGGGREHAMGWSIAQDPEVTEVIYFKGNPGTEQDEKGRNIDLDGTQKENFGKLADVVTKEDIGMLVVGPEQPLVDGIVNFFNERGYDGIFGPTSAASAIEADKFFSYDIMKKAGVFQADSILCTTTKQAEQALKKMTIFSDTGSGPFGVVIKARGLTGGKGVYVCDSKEEALASIKEHTKAYGSEVLIAERLFGQEFSVFGLSDGERVSPLEISVQDHKPLLDGDRGPNTGGMGAYCPAPIADAETVRMVADKMTLIVQEMKKQGKEYKGFLYAAVIMTDTGPKILEYNARFGDPEAQPAVMMLKNGLYQPIKYALDGKLDEIDVKFKEGAACCVVMASNGYPDSGFAKHVKGLRIGELDTAEKFYDVKVFHAGTAYDENKKIVVNGGRVTGITGYSADGIKTAQEKTYRAVQMIDKATTKINNKRVFIYRNDIAEKAIR